MFDNVYSIKSICSNQQSNSNTNSNKSIELSASDLLFHNSNNTTTTSTSSSNHTTLTQQQTILTDNTSLYFTLALNKLLSNFNDNKQQQQEQQQYSAQLLQHILLNSSNTLTQINSNIGNIINQWFNQSKDNTITNNLFDLSHNHITQSLQQQQQHNVLANNNIQTTRAQTTTQHYIKQEPVSSYKHSAQDYHSVNLWSKSVEQQVIDLYQSGLSVVEIGNTLNRSVGSIENKLRKISKLQYKRDHKTHNMQNIQRNKLVTTTNTANRNNKHNTQLRATKNTVSIKQSGVNTANMNTGGRHQWTELQVKQLTRLRKQGVNRDETAKQMNRTVSNVVNKTHKLGLFNASNKSTIIDKPTTIDTNLLSEGDNIAALDDHDSDNINSNAEGNQQSKPWTLVDDNLLSMFVVSSPNNMKYYAKELGRTVDDVTKHILQMNNNRANNQLQQHTSQSDYYSDTDNNSFDITDQISTANTFDNKLINKQHVRSTLINNNNDHIEIFETATKQQKTKNTAIKQNKKRKLAGSETTTKTIKNKEVGIDDIDTTTTSTTNTTIDTVATSNSSKTKLSDDDKFAIGVVGEPYTGDLSKRWSGLKETDVSYVRCITNYWYDIDNKLLSLLLDNAYNTKHVHHKLFVKLVAQSDRRYLVRYENWIDIEADDWHNIGDLDNCWELVAEYERRTLQEKQLLRNYTLNEIKERISQLEHDIKLKSTPVLALEKKHKQFIGLQAPPPYNRIKQGDLRQRCNVLYKARDELLKQQRKQNT